MNPMFGTWRNTDPDTSGVVSLAFDRDRVQAWASAGRSLAPIDLGHGEVEWYGGREDPTPLAFTSTTDSVLLQGNINRGLMILAAYRYSTDAAPLAGRFCREFYARHEEEIVPPPATSEGVLFGAIRASAAPVLEEFVGEWRNADPASSLPSLEITDALHVTVEGAGPRATAQTFAYYDELGRDTLLLLANLERSVLQIKVVLGTAVVAGFHRSADGRRWFQRDFFRRPRRSRS